MFQYYPLWAGQKLKFPSSLSSSTLWLLLLLCSYDAIHRQAGRQIDTYKCDPDYYTNDIERLLFAIYLVATTLEKILPFNRSAENQSGITSLLLVPQPILLESIEKRYLLSLTLSRRVTNVTASFCRLNSIFIEEKWRLSLKFWWFYNY